jgi:hypothetical protein
MRGLRRWRDLHSYGRAALVGAIAAPLLLGAFALVGAPAPAGAQQAGTTGPMPLQEFANDDAGGRLWNSYDQTAIAEGPEITGRPSPLISGSSVYVFVRAAGGDLTEFVNDGLNGRLWNAYDRTQTSGGPAIVGDPGALLLDPNETAVFAQASGGELVEFVNDGADGHSWNAYNLTQLTSGRTIAGDPAPLLVGSSIDVFGRAADGDLFEFSQPTAAGGSWSATDLSQVAGGQTIAGDPEGVLYGTSSLHVYATAASGDLIEFVNDGAGGRPWNAYNLTVAAAGPTVTGRPSPITYGTTVHVDVTASSGDLVEFDNDGANHRLWNSYDLTAAADGPTVVGDPSAVLSGGVSVHVYAQSSKGDLIEFVNDGAGGRLWNSYDQSQTVGGLQIGGDPGAAVYGTTVHVYVAGPPPPEQVQQIVSLAEQADQYNAAVLETPPGSNCNPYTFYFGRGSTTGCAPGTSAEEWCADFAEWVWASAGISTTGIDGWAYSFVDWGEAHTGAWQPGDANNPEPGDAVVWGDLSTTYAIHVGIVVGVSQGMIDVVAGNAGPPIDAAGDVDAVWDSGYFDPTTSTVGGYPIIGYVSPTSWTGISPQAKALLRPLSSSTLAHDIARQDGGR